MSDVRSEPNRNSSFARVSSVHLSGVGPEHITHNSTIRGLSKSISLSDIFEGDAIVSKESSVSNEYLIINDVPKRKAAESFSENVKYFSIVFSDDFSLETVEFIHISALMITTSKAHMFGVHNLPSEKCYDHLERKWATINEISVKQVGVFFTWVSIDFKDIKKVVKLAMGVTADCNFLFIRNGKINKSLFFLENFFDFNEDLEEGSFMELLLFSEVLHHTYDPFSSNIFDLFKFRTVIVWRDGDTSYIYGSCFLSRKGFLPFLLSSRIVNKF